MLNRFFAYLNPFSSAVEILGGTQKQQLLRVELSLLLEWVTLAQSQPGDGLSKDHFFLYIW
jgi:hypothetical protein